MKTDYNTRRAYIDLIQDTTRPNTFKIAMIYTAVSARGEGLATDLLREVCADADREGATLTLAVVPEQTGGKAPNVAQLWNWYAKHGFVEAVMQSGPARMIRAPKHETSKTVVIKNAPYGAIRVTENWGRLFLDQDKKSTVISETAYSELLNALRKLIQPPVPMQEPPQSQPGQIEPNFPIMRVVESDGAVSWLDGHNEQDAFETFGPNISIAFMWGRVK